VDWDERRFPVVIATSFIRVSRRPFESAQYAALKYRRRLAAAELVGSMGRRGHPYDNARMESLTKTVKVEGVYPLAFENEDDVAAHLPRFIEADNERRRHSSLG
jgi:putative transposase